MMDVTRQINWVPSFGLDRELDWLAHMDDWMISKKRYWGLALPIYECAACGTFEVIGSETELRERAVEGWDEFGGTSPHRPWIDAVKIACRSCGETVSRITDVGNPWLDAGIVPFSTLNYRHDRDYWEEWYPGRLDLRELPGPVPQLVLLDDRPEHRARPIEPAFRNVFSYALMRDEKGEEMHKSKGNAIWFDDAAEEIGRRRHALALLDASTRRRTSTSAITSLTRSAADSSCRSGTPTRSSRPTPRLDGFDPTDRRQPGAARRAHAARPLDHLPAESARRRGPRRARRLRPGSRRDEHRAVRRRRALELVHPPQSPALLEERERCRQGRRLPDAL